MGEAGRLGDTVLLLNGWREVFLSRFEATGNLTRSARAAGVTRGAVYEAAKRDPAFGQRVQASFDALLDNLEGRAFERGLEKSDGLLMFMLRAHRRRVYGDRREVTVSSGGVDLERVKWLRENLSPDQLRTAHAAVLEGNEVFLGEEGLEVMPAVVEVEE